jgi:hypothetical protein
MAWLAGWDYRKSIAISRASGAVSNYQMPVKVYYGSGSDGTETINGISASKVYISGKCLSDFSDIRFTSSDGTTVLDCWLISKVDESYAIFWVEYPLIGTGATTFYVYYTDRVETSISFNAASIVITSDGTIWAGHMTDGTIRKSINDGASWTTKYTFSVGNGPVRCIWIAANGYIFASRDDSDILVRSTDGGENWSTCKTLSGSGDSVVWHMAQDSGGNIYVGEYSTGDGTETCAYVYKSTDNGANWTTIWNNPDGARHIHFVAVDPYTDRLYLSQGDLAKGKLAYSDNQGADWTAIGSGSSLWHPTCVAFGDGYRLFGQDNINSPPVLIRKTTNDADFTTAYTPPATDDKIFWNGGKVNSDGLIVFASWTQDDNERATIVGTVDGGVTWGLLEIEATGAGNRGFLDVASKNQYFYITRSIETDIGKYSFGTIYTSVSSHVNTMIKADNGVSGNFSETTAGSATISHASGKYTITEDTTDDAGLTGASLASWNIEVSIDQLDTFIGIDTGQIIYFGFFDSATLAAIVGDVNNYLARYRFVVVRYASNHATLANKIALLYRGTDDSNNYYNGNGWTTSATTFETSGTIVVKLWSDGTNLLCNILSGGSSIFTSVASIALSSVKAFSAGKFEVFGDMRSDAYAMTSTIKDYFIRQYVSPEPAWGAWGEESGETISYSYSAQAGCLVGGSSLPKFIRDYIPSGGLVTGGLSVERRIFKPLIGGGSVIAGDSTFSKGINQVATGGAVTAGGAGLARLLNMLANGGVVIGGSSLIGKLNHIFASGGSVVAGFASIWTTIVRVRDTFLFPQDLIGDIRPSSNPTKSAKSEFGGDMILDSGLTDLSVSDDEAHSFKQDKL